MFNKPLSLAVTILGTTVFAWMAACSSSKESTDNSSSNTGGATSSSSSSTSLGSGTSSSSSGTGSSGTSSTGASGDGGSSPLQIDNQSAAVGSQLQFGSSVKALVPSGDKIGTWYTYGWNAAAGQTLTPAQGAPFSFTTTTGMFTRAACVSSAGYVGYSAGEGFNFATADVDSSNPPAVPLNVSSFTGITFWAMSTTTGTPMVRVKFPDDQTYGSDPTALCQPDASLPTGDTAGQCDDDFCDNVTLTSSWTQVSILFSNLNQSSFGATFPGGLDTKNVFGIQFENEGGGTTDAGAPGFQYCIADINFTQ